MGNEDKDSLLSTEDSKNSSLGIGKRSIARALFFGVAGFIIFIEIKRFGGTTVIWGALGAIAGIGAPIIWDFFKKVKDEEKAFQNEVDARFDRLEQTLPTFMTHTELDTLRADIGIARADCERALEISKFSNNTAISNQERINDIISSGVIFQLTQAVTGMRLQLSIIKRVVLRQPISLDFLLNEIEDDEQK